MRRVAVAARAQFAIEASENLLEETREMAALRLARLFLFGSFAGFFFSLSLTSLLLFFLTTARFFLRLPFTLFLSSTLSLRFALSLFFSAPAIPAVCRVYWTAEVSARYSRWRDTAA